MVLPDKHKDYQSLDACRVPPLCESLPPQLNKTLAVGFMVWGRRRTELLRGIGTCRA